MPPFWPTTRAARRPSAGAAAGFGGARLALRPRVALRWHVTNPHARCRKIRTGAATATHAVLMPERHKRHPVPIGGVRRPDWSGVEHFALRAGAVEDCWRMVGLASAEKSDGRMQYGGLRKR